MQETSAKHSWKRQALVHGSCNVEHASDKRSCASHNCSGNVEQMVQACVCVCVFFLAANYTCHDQITVRAPNLLANLSKGCHAIKMWLANLDPQKAAMLSKCGSLHYSWRLSQSAAFPQASILDDGLLEEYFKVTDGPSPFGCLQRYCVRLPS